MLSAWTASDLGPQSYASTELLNPIRTRTHLARILQVEILPIGSRPPYPTDADGRQPLKGVHYVRLVRRVRSAKRRRSRRAGWRKRAVPTVWLDGARIRRAPDGRDPGERLPETAHQVAPERQEQALQRGDRRRRSSVLHGRWMLLTRTIDRANDWYSEKVVDPRTGEVVHQCEEPLSAHRGHGAAKR